MKIASSVASAIVALALAVLPADAATYIGPGTSLGASLGDGAGISSVNVGNTASTISFTINSSAPQAAYIFYGIELQIVGQAGNGYTGFSNPFGPAIGISSGENALVDTYGNGATPYLYSGGWVAGTSVSYTAGGTGATFSSITVPLSSLGLSVGNSFYFDVVSTYAASSDGGPQAAYGALDSTGYPAENNNSYVPYDNNTYYDSATDATSTFNTGASLYTVASVPEPATWTLLGLGICGVAGRALRGRMATNK
jgi:PEP-CTERM motif